MNKLWGGRFQAGTEKNAESFHSSISFDSRLFEEDILLSTAHAQMLCEIGVLNESECENIVNGLKTLLEEIKSGRVQFDSSDEDIHMNIERLLLGLIGNDAKKLHTGRSRNDQVATDMRIFIRNATYDLQNKLKCLMREIVAISKDNLETYMSAYTHLQKAQPSTLAHYLMAYYEMFYRDFQRFEDSISRLNICPLGSGALCATTYPLDRPGTASKLGFDGITNNSIDGVSDRDFICEFISICSICMVHLSRFCEEFILWSTNEFALIKLSDKYSTGSSIMPQKKNPDMAELIRGKSGRVFGDLMTILTVLKGLPLAYNKDMQEDKECAFDAFDTLSACLDVFCGMLNSTEFNKEKLKSGALLGFTNATDFADYLVGLGVAFRDAHEISGRAILYCEEKNCSLTDLSVEEFHSFCPLINEDVYYYLSLETCINRRNIPGGPAKDAVLSHIKKAEDFLSD